MREILFRGQTRKKGEKVRLDGSPIESNWVYGGIFPNNEGGDFAIIYQKYPEIKKYPVYSDSVGQYTGLTDKNGKRIFEGDIVKCSHVKTDNIALAVIKYGRYTDVDSLDDYDYLGWYLEIDKHCISILSPENDGIEMEVIGNIHDNSKLFEV